MNATALKEEYKDEVKQLDKRMADARKNIEIADILTKELGYGLRLSHTGYEITKDGKVLESEGHYTRAHATSNFDRIVRKYYWAKVEAFCLRVLLEEERTGRACAERYIDELSSSDGIGKVYE